MNDTVFDKSSLIAGGVSTIISSLSYLVLFYTQIMVSYSPVILYFSFAIFVVGLIFRFLSKRKDLSLIPIVFGGVLFVLSLGFQIFSFCDNRKMQEVELISDATSSLVEISDAQGEKWIEESLDNGDLVCMLFPVGEKTDYFYHLIIDELHAKKVFGPNHAPNFITFTDVKVTDKHVKVQYRICLSDSKEIRDLFKNDKRFIVLPSSINLVAQGWRKMKQDQFSLAKEFFEKADSLGNSTGTYYLSKWYRSGYGCDPDAEKAHSLLYKAAQNGCRIARYEWSDMILRDSTSSALQRGVAADLLRKAACLETLATPYTAANTMKSIYLLNQYYRMTGRYEKAYGITKDSYSTFGFDEHLDNCLSLGKYNEALKIIKKGMRLRDPYCYFIYGGMLTNGLGVKQNFQEAEKQLRFAADTLNYYPAYKGLAVLYSKANKKGSDFWENLYNVKFDNTVNE